MKVRTLTLTLLAAALASSLAPESAHAFSGSFWRNRVFRKKSPPPPPRNPEPPALRCDAVPDGAFQACYFNGLNFGELKTTRTIGAVDFDWQDGSPDPSVRSDGFSARFTGSFEFSDSNYTFTVTSDDGVRLFVDGELVIDDWNDHGPENRMHARAMSPGKHRIVLEYYENEGGAVARLSWREQEQDTGPWPDDAWPTGTPESQGMDSARLRAIPDAEISHGVVIRNGVEVFGWGDPGRSQQTWSSVTRSYLTTAWGMAIHDGTIPGGLALLESRVRELPSPTAAHFAGDVLLKHLLSYTSCSTPAGSRWQYSCGDDWFDQYRIFRELTGMSVHDYLNSRLFPILGGGVVATPLDDERGETSRIIGSPRAHARWAYFWLHHGRWRDQQLVAPEFVARTIHPGPDGQGPNINEGWQIHLNGDGTAVPGCPTDSFFAYGAVDRAVVFASPSLNLVVARYNSNHGYGIEVWAGKICSALMDG